MITARITIFWDQGEKLKIVGWIYHPNCSSWLFQKLRSAFVGTFWRFCTWKRPFYQMFLALCKCKLDHTWRPTEVCLLPVPLRREHELRGCRVWCCHLPLHFWLQPPPRRKHHRRVPRQNTGRTGSLKTKATSPETACAVRKYRFWMVLYQRQHTVPSNNQEPHKQNYISTPRQNTNKNIPPNTNSTPQLKIRMFISPYRALVHRPNFSVCSLFPPALLHKRPPPGGRALT